MAAHEKISPQQFVRYTHSGTSLNVEARRLAPQGDANRLWEMADYHALKGNWNDEEVYRRAARLREKT